MRNYPLGERLRELRQQRGLERSELADQLGMTVGKLGHLENGVRGVSVPDLVKIAKVFDMSLDDLVPVDDNGDLVDGVVAG